MEHTLPNNENIKVNDHVYCSPNWAARDGTPYSIARVMEFLTDDSTTRGTRAKAKEAFTKVRLAWFYRPSDVSDRQVTESRLLLCAIYSEIIPITQLRGKCYVKHKDKIPDLVTWKKLPNRFYFNRLFDPFIKREFEVILISDVHNLPKHIKDNLASRYDMIVTEKDCVAELTDSLRICDTCGEWCPSSDSVQCDTCKSHFHMACVQPPLLAKPARGYGWSCARCAHKDEDEERSNTPTTSVKPKSTGGRGRGGRPKLTRSSTATAAPTKQLDETEDKYYKMWPFRYFGQYTVAEDTLDPEDIIFPRANTRVGIKFQASVPTTGSSLPPPGPDIPERGTDETIEILSYVSKMSEREVEECKHRILRVKMRVNFKAVEVCKAALAEKPEAASSVDWLTELIRRFSVAYLQKEPCLSVNLKNPMRLPKWSKEEIRYTDREWNDTEKHAFEAGIMEFGPELRSVREQIVTRSFPEVVRYFAWWKARQLGEENQRIIEARKHGRLTPSKSATQLLTSSSEEEKSVVNVKQDGRGTASLCCAACRTRQSNRWWKAPKGLSTSVMCEDCGLKWRKYGDLSAKVPKDDGLTAKQRTSVVEKREGTPLTVPATKRMKVFTMPSSVGPMVKHITCQCCRKPGPVGKVIKCIQCSMTIHAGICGAVPSGTGMEVAEAEGWICEICQNETSLEASLISDCVLCPEQSSDDNKKSGSVLKDDDDFGFLRARKPTEGQSWAHILCSLYAPEVLYTDATHLRLVEGISAIGQSRWKGICATCNHQGGICVKCSLCPNEYHPACAWRCGIRLAFEMQGVKASKRDSTIQVEFKRDTGAMTPVLFCKLHNIDGKRLHDFCDMNEKGETAIQVFVKNYKQVALDNSYALLRKARRLDVIMASHSEKVHKGKSPELPPVPDIKCCICGTEYSPFFHAVENKRTSDDDEHALLHECHACYFSKKITQQSLGQPPELEGSVSMVVTAG